ncbi:hypothetical protein [Erythrobacter ani]|uniref:Uncharacterized protein n=1 Tax=Erythrobacter ani TaxID=2827235 RepID=A0ABS6SMI3_9SPHN|nr:hypothetical protein [Erythrobacter ani]MBV7266246.1 hypothetical protein [Erythrobacter ani]
MSVEIKEVVSTVRVQNRSTAALDDRTMATIVATAVRAVEDRMARQDRRAAATEIADDGRGNIARQSWSARV